MLRIGMHPDPFLETHWSRTANPNLKWEAEAIQQAGGEVVGLTTRQARNPAIWKKLGLDVVHLHWPAAVFNFRVRREPLQKVIPHAWVQYWTHDRLARWEKAVHQANLPLVWEVHDTLSHHAYAYNYKADLYLHQKFYELAGGVLLHGEKCREPVKSLYGQGDEKHFEVAPLGSYRGLYGPPISRAAALQQLGIQGDGRILAYLGTARPMRNPAASIQAFTQLASKQDLLLVAGGGVEAYLPENLDARVKVYPGVLSPELFLQLVCAADFLINDGPDYMTSAILRLAMSYARPVITYPFGSALDMAAGAAIWIPDTKDGLGTAILAALKLPEAERLRLSQTAAELENQHTWEKCGEACMRLYHHVIKQKTTDSH